MNHFAIEPLGTKFPEFRQPRPSILFPGQSLGTPGFTLLEILLAITIFSIVMTTIFGSFRAVFFNTESLERKADLDEMANSCLTRMALDLQSLKCSLLPAYHPPDTDDDPDEYRLVGDFSEGAGLKAGRLRFTSLNHLSFHNAVRQGVSEIVYYLYATPDGQTVVKRADHLYPYPDFEESAKDATLCEYVRSLKFVYFDQEGDEHERWDSESDDFKYATPTAIGIHIEVGDENYSRVAETIVALPVQRREIG
jgi:general secretion pathway protein J